MLPHFSSGTEQQENDRGLPISPRLGPRLAVISLNKRLSSTCTPHRAINSLVSNDVISRVRLARRDLYLRYRCHWLCVDCDTSWVRRTCPLFTWKSRRVCGCYSLAYALRDECALYSLTGTMSVLTEPAVNCTHIRMMDEWAVNWAFLAPLTTPNNGLCTQYEGSRHVSREWFYIPTCAQTNNERHVCISTAIDAPLMWHFGWSLFFFFKYSNETISKMKEFTWIRL